MSAFTHDAPESAMYVAYVDSSGLTAQFSCVSALKKRFMVATTVNFCKSFVSLAVIARQINWDML